MSATTGTIWTIGHSTRPWEEFVELLKANGVVLLVDIRSMPGSRRYPHFDREHLEKFLPESGIKYLHMIDLGGRRKPQKNSPNVAWRHPAFRGYADYMQTDAFQKAVEQLEQLAADTPTAYMCAEAPWWKCHRALVSDYLKARGWEVLHIMEKGKVTPHPYTRAARTAQGELFYDDVRPSQ